MVICRVSRFFKYIKIKKRYDVFYAKVSNFLAMNCPYCNYSDSKVIDSRLIAEGLQIRRRRECVNCTERFTTYESAELVMPKVIKRDGCREPFDEEKMRLGIEISLRKRKVSNDDMEKCIERIKQSIRSRGEREIKSDNIGSIIMRELYNLDTVAYVRFASVYKKFESIDNFQSTINEIKLNN